MHVIGTAGHVDHGKSALIHRLTGIDPDRFEEEKRRGLTIDLGFAWLALPSGNEVGIIDVPGHERFIKNMLAGAGGITVCLFVVAANEGWMPQSAEHLSAIDVLGISAGVVAVTKSDAVDEETVALAVAEAEEKISRSSLRGAKIVACSAHTGAGIDDLIGALDRVVKGTPPAPDLERPRLWVDRVFTISGAGTVVTGTLAGGGFAVGDEVEIAPEGRAARIRAIQSHKKEVRAIAPGNRVALNLAGLDRQGAERGDAVVRRASWRPTARVDARVRVVDSALSGHAHELTEKGAHLLYVGSAETPVRIKLLDVDRLPSGSAGYSQLYLRDPLPLARDDRFVLRDAGRVMTFGGGVVLDPHPALARRGDEDRIALLRSLDGASPEDAAVALVSGGGPMSAADVLSRSGAAAIPEILVSLGGTVISHADYDALIERVRSVLGDHHAAHPLERGLAREALRRVVGLDDDAFDRFIASTAELVEKGALVRLSSHEVSLDADQANARRKVMEMIESAGFTPPLAAQLDTDPALLNALVAAGDLVKIGDFYLTRAQAANARARVRQRIEEEGPQTVAQIRDLLGTSRKYAVPLCEWLDSTGATLRRGDVRLAGPTL